MAKPGIEKKAPLVATPRTYVLTVLFWIAVISLLLGLFKLLGIRMH